MYLIKQVKSRVELNPGFHMIVQIVPIATIVSKYFETIRRTETIASFDMIVSIVSTKARDEGSSAMSLGQTIEFYRVFRKQAKDDDFYSESEPRALLSSFSLDFVRREASRVPRRHSNVTSRT